MGGLWLSVLEERFPGVTPVRLLEGRVEQRETAAPTRPAQEHAAAA